MPSTPGRLLIQYQYDALDRLVSDVPANQLQRDRFYQQDRLTTEIEGVLQRQIFQGSKVLLAERHQEKTLLTSWLITDQQGSVLKAFGTRSAYTPYGHRPTGDDLTSLMGFNGERADSITGHYLLGNGHRAFNPVLMRFNRPDSLSPFGKGGLNSYAYCAGDPVNRTDPTGKWFGWGWFASNLFQMAGEYLTPLVPKRWAAWIPGIKNPTFGRATKITSDVSGFLAGLSYVPVSLIDNIAFTEARYAAALTTHLGISSIAVVSGALSTLHQIATRGKTAVPVLTAVPRRLSTVSRTSSLTRSSSAPSLVQLSLESRGSVKRTALMIREGSQTPQNNT
ncbi:RHS repeat-associated core domain-containing protein [Pseudomonas beijingensis]|jgi:RHS repeat-associated protein|uniref:RHS repeat-associated core domain-containing protein n=1 Tax=Pseudomonas beijingensis TaxID=2954101 RepID=UPI0027373143|nr:RHS repeat-associated core domain-containing protein [Pseudomonas sp. FP2262]WLH46743.1 RHS repeat-associated core domain-containing protein [Pseudomonas sp. FP2262]